MRERFSISLDEDSIKAISTLSAQTGLTKSFIVSQWIMEGLKRDNRLSHSERFFFSKKIIIENIEALFTSIGFKSNNGDICNNVILLYLIPEKCFASNTEYELFKASIFQLLDRIQSHDNKLFEHIVNSLKELNLKVSKNSELSETSLLPASGTGMY